MPVYAAPTQNFLQKTLDAELLEGVTASATLNNTTGLQNLPGVMLIDRIDTNDNPTPTKREIIAFSGTSGATVTTLSRGLAGSSDQDHAVGAIVEFAADVIWAQSIYDALVNVVVASTGAVDTTKIVTPTGTQTLTNKTLTSPAMTTPSVTSGDMNLATGLNIQVNSTDPWRTVSIFGGMKPATTAGCAAKTTIEAGTNDLDYDVLDFDKTTDERAFVNFQMPDSFAGGAVQFRYVWTASGGGSADTLTMELKGIGLGNDDAIDQASGTAVELADTWIADGDIHTSGWSGDVTLANTPVAGDYVHFEIMRDVSEDDLDTDARIMDVQIRYKQGSYSD